MQPITPSCRSQLSAADIEFIANALVSTPTEKDNLLGLLADEAARDAILESDRLFQAIVAVETPLPISPRLYFYVLTRRVLPQSDRAVTDYIASLLAKFLEGNRWQTLPGLPDIQTQYVTDMLAVLANLKGTQAFLLQAHVGNYSLFVSGIFPGYIQHRATYRGAPDLSFYEGVGRTHYHLAADQLDARQAGLTDVLHTIGDDFAGVRRGLNRVAEQFLHWKPPA